MTTNANKFGDLTKAQQNAVRHYFYAVARGEDTSLAKDLIIGAHGINPDDYRLGVFIPKDAKFTLAD